ncbi:MAG: hypothetical protein ACRDSG_08825 [Pseudonocardiaceae bacterium]
MHLDPFHVLRRGGREPGPYDGGWNDTVDLRLAEDVEVVVRFSDHPGPTRSTATTWSTRTWR